MDMASFVVIGGEAEAIRDRLEGTWNKEAGLPDAVKASVGALAGPDRTLVGDDLEVAVLARQSGRRAFRRVEGDELDALLA